MRGLADRDQPPQPIDLVDVEMDKWSEIWTTHPVESVPDLTGLPGYRVPDPPTAKELVAATSRFKWWTGVGTDGFIPMAAS